MKTHARELAVDEYHAPVDPVRRDEASLDRKVIGSDDTCILSALGRFHHSRRPTGCW